MTGRYRHLVILVASAALGLTVSYLPAGIAYVVGAVWGAVLILGRPRPSYLKAAEEASWLVAIRAGTPDGRVNPAVNCMNLRQDLPAEAVGQMLLHVAEQMGSVYEHLNERAAEEREHPKLAQARAVLRVVVLEYFTVLSGLEHGSLYDLLEAEKQHYMGQLENLSPATDPELLEAIVAEYPALVGQVKRRAKQK